MPYSFGNHVTPELGSSASEGGGRRLWGVVILGLVLGLGFQGSRGLYGPDEGRYAECAREMLESGDWLTPRLNGQQHLSKPPLTYWMIASGMKLLGQNEWGARLGQGLVYAATGLVVVLLGRGLWNDGVGILAGLIYLTAPLPFVSATIITTDGLLTLLTTLAYLCYWLARQDAGSARSRRWIVAMWVALGAAFMTKGHVSLLLFLPIVVFHTIERRRGRSTPRLVNWLGLAAFACIGFWWFVVICSKDQGALVYFLRQQIAGHTYLRVAEAHHSAWYGSITVYGPTLLGGMLPWSVVWPVAALVRKRRSQTALRFGPLEPSALLLALWFGLPFIVFCLVLSHLPLYVQPLFPPLALAAARSLTKPMPDGAETARAPRWPVALALIWATIMFGVKAGAPYLSIKRDSRILWQHLQPLIARPGTRMFFMRKPDYGIMFYTRHTIPQVGLDTQSLQKLFPPRQPAAPPRRTVFMHKERCMPMPMHSLSTLGKPPRMVKLAFGWAALVVDEPTSDVQSRDGIKNGAPATPATSRTSRR